MCLFFNSFSNPESKRNDHPADEPAFHHQKPGLLSTKIFFKKICKCGPQESRQCNLPVLGSIHCSPVWLASGRAVLFASGMTATSTCLGGGTFISCGGCGFSSPKMLAFFTVLTFFHTPFTSTCTSPVAGSLQCNLPVLWSTHWSPDSWGHDVLYNQILFWS